MEEQVKKQSKDIGKLKRIKKRKQVFTEKGTEGRNRYKGPEEIKRQRGEKYE